MTYADALEYIHSVSWMGSRPGLDRTRKLMELLGNPQDRLKFVHVAGTNGKGSVSAMTAAALTEAGYVTGLYTSPFILRFNERMRVNGRDIADDELAEITEYVRPFAESMEDKPTEFELITAIAFVYFDRHGCDVVVLEVGMGGALDSTNIIKTPCLSIITGIAMDHTAFLGDTPAKIAAQKAGIIKSGVPVLFGTQHGSFDAGESGGLDESDREEVARVIRAEAQRKGAPFYSVDLDSLNIHSRTLDGCDFSFDGKDYHIPLLGLYQPYNAAIALTACKLLREQGMDISYDTVRRGLEGVEWKGRFEILSRKPLVISDGAHNPEGIDAAVRSAREYFSGKKINILTGVMADKDYDYMIESISRVALRAYTVRPDNSRALDASEYAKDFLRHGVSATSYRSVKDAMEAAIAEHPDVPLLCVGSLYMYGEVVAAVEELLLSHKDHLCV